MGDVPFRRMDRITGRSDDMLIVRGVNIFPRQIEELILAEGARAALPHRRQPRGDQWTCSPSPAKARTHASENLGARMKSRYGLSARVTIVTAGTLPSRRQGETRFSITGKRHHETRIRHRRRRRSSSGAASRPRCHAQGVERAHRTCRHALDRARPARPRCLGARGQLQPRRACRRCRRADRWNERDDPRPFDGRRCRARARPPAATASRLAACSVSASRLRGTTTSWRA